MSSAYLWNLTPKLDMTSPSEVLNSEKSSGPRMDTCGTTASELSVVDMISPTFTKHERPSR